MMIGGGIVLFFILVSLVVALADLFHLQITPYNPIQQNVGPPLASPSLKFLLELISMEGMSLAGYLRVPRMDFRSASL